jgi:hypothetical protein
MITDQGARPNEPQDFQNFIEAYTRGRACQRYCRDPFRGASILIQFSETHVEMPLRVKRVFSSKIASEYACVSGNIESVGRGVDPILTVEFD